MAEKPQQPVRPETSNHAGQEVPDVATNLARELAEVSTRVTVLERFVDEFRARVAALEQAQQDQQARALEAREGGG